MELMNVCYIFTQKFFFIQGSIPSIVELLDDVNKENVTPDEGLPTEQSQKVDTAEVETACKEKSTQETSEGIG